MIIGVDIDDTILNLIDTWLSVYNTEFEDNLKPEDIIDWNISLFVKPESKEKIYDYIYDPDTFYASLPVEGALNAINYIKSFGHRTVFITANNPEDCKFHWLKEHGFIESRDDLVTCTDKSLICCDYLIDDKPENVQNSKGVGILVNRPWNAYFFWKNRANNWKEVLEILKI